MQNLKLNNLRKELMKSTKNNSKETITAIKNSKSLEDLKKYHFVRCYFTPTTINKPFTLKEAKEYLIKRVNKKTDKKLNDIINYFNSVLNSGDFIEARISVSWSRSATWGMNPKAEIRYTYKNKDGHMRSEYFETGSIGGCGYDKLSTAVAQSINEVKPILKLLYKNKNKNVKSTNREHLGYGSGYGVLPRLEGGVGVECYPRIFKKIGFKFESIASGKNFDVFTITKFKK